MHAPVASVVDQLLAASRRAFEEADPVAAENYLMGARDHDPENPAVLLRLGEIAMARRQYDVAAALIRRALVARPNDPTVLAQLGNVLWRGQHYEESYRALLSALMIAPGNKLVLQNIGLWHYFAGDPDQAVHYLGRALEVAPDDRWIRSDHAHAVLKSGDLHRGLELFEARWGVVPHGPVWDCGLPLWGQETHTFAGQTLLLHAEQGFGDTLQFIRYVPMIKEHGGFSRVLFAGPLPLKRLIEGQCGVDEFFDHERTGEVCRAAREAHCHAPLITAVSRLGLSYDTLPAPEPYLEVLSHSPRELRPGGARVAVGLVWAASLGHERSRQRSIPVTSLLELGTVPGVRLWSLQMAPFAREAVETGSDLVISDATTSVMDFMDTAQIVQAMDCVVTVDTAMVHLCGALGKTCFMLNPINSCWRWARGAAPWYGSVELFNQNRDLSWSDAIFCIRDRIVALTGAA